MIKNRRIYSLITVIFVSSSFFFSHSAQINELTNKTQRLNNKISLNQSTNTKLYDKIYIISLDRSPERYSFVKTQLDKFNLKYEKFSAIDGKLITIKDLSSNQKIPWYKMNSTPNNYYYGATLKISYKDLYKNAEFFYVRDNYLLNFGELGCAMSHRAVWNDIVKHTYNRAIIFEDNIILSKDFFNKLSLILSNLPNDFDVFFLDITFVHQPKNTHFTPPNFWLKRFSNTSSPYYAKIKPNKNVGGFRAYIINSNSAQKLLEKTKYIHMPIDNTIMLSELNLYVSKLKLVLNHVPDSVIWNTEKDNKK